MADPLSSVDTSALLKWYVSEPGAGAVATADRVLANAASTLGMTVDYFGRP